MRPSRPRSRVPVGVLLMASIGALAPSCGRTPPWGWQPPPKVAHDGDPCLAAGARLCGGACPELPAPECPGYGCTHTLSTVTEQETAAGVCWSELADRGTRLCPAGCADGEVCARRDGDELVCVPEEVCFDLLALGGGDGCVYADLTRYDGEALGPQPDDCPPGGAGLLCGGCGCPGRCIGRSPDTPWGLCVRADRPLTGCSLHPTEAQFVSSCFYASLGIGQEPVCMLFDVEPSSFARANGVCVSRERCLALAALTGRLQCYDYQAERIDG